MPQHWKTGMSVKIIEQENTIRRLKGEEIAKVCKMCVHYRRKHGIGICTRDLHTGFHNVTGKVEEQGKTHYCDNEREIEASHPTLVENGSKCGAIGQFFEPAPPTAPKISWLRGWFKKSNK